MTHCKNLIILHRNYDPKTTLTQTCIHASMVASQGDLPHQVLTDQESDKIRSERELYEQQIFTFHTGYSLPTPLASTISHLNDF